MKYLSLILAFASCLSGHAASSSVMANSSGVLTAPATFFSANLGLVSVKTFGAVGNGTTDDTAAIQAAANYAHTFVTSDYDTHRPILYFPPALGYKITAVVTVSTNIHVRMDAPIISAISGGNVTALTIGVAGSYSVNLNHEIAIRRSTVSNWSSENDIGVRFYGLTSSHVYLRDIQNFTIGGQFMGDAQGIAQCEIKIGAIYNCKIKVDGNNRNSGWFNQNQIIGGRLTDDISVNPTLSRYGVRITSEDGSYVNNNANVLRDISFEMRGSTLTGGAEAIPWLVVHGNGNRLTGAWRTEGNAGYSVRYQNNSRLNIKEPAGYTDSPTQGGDDVDNQSAYPNMTVGRPYAINLPTTVPTLKIFDSGPLYKNAIRHFGTNWYSIAGVHFAVSANSNILSTTSGIGVYSDYVDLPSSTGLGVLVDVEKCKHILAVKDAVAPKGGQWVVRCFDSTGAIIANPGAGGYVKGSIGLADTASWGGAARTGDIADTPMLFEFSSAVKRADFIVSGNNTNATIRSFALFSADGYSATAWQGYYPINSGIQINEIPNENGKTAGQFVWNESGSGAMGWKWTGASWVAYGAPYTWLYNATADTLGFGTAASSSSNTIISVRRDSAATVASILRNANPAGAAILQLDGEGANTGNFGIFGSTYTSAAFRNRVGISSGSGMAGVFVSAAGAGQTYDVLINSVRAGRFTESGLTLNTNLVLSPITKAARNALTPVEGMVVMQSDNTPGIRFYENGAWVRPTVSADP